MSGFSSLGENPRTDDSACLTNLHHGLRDASQGGNFLTHDFTGCILYNHPFNQVKILIREKA